MCGKWLVLHLQLGGFDNLKSRVFDRVDIVNLDLRDTGFLESDLGVDWNGLEPSLVSNPS